jgi:hypothetical protein
MSRIRSQNEIILSLLDFYRVAQPNLDIKPGTVSRDLFVDGMATQISRLYEELSRVSTLQSLRLALGSDLDRLASNFAASRRRGSKSSGPALLTFNELTSDIAINKGDIVSARNGATFVVTTGIVVSPVFANSFKAIASQYRADLDLLGITDTYAVEVTVEATAPGTQGNVSKYSLSSTEISGVNNVVNVSPFGGGRAAEDDASFRSRVLAIFSGANTGTALGYKNAVLEDPAVLDAVVIEPGDTLMTRDGTQVSVAEDGTKTIVSEGSGGKVDIYIFGSRLQETIDSFIYRDLSNTNDPTNSANDFVLGQVDGDENKTVTRKRLDNIASGVLPEQPVNNIIEITGSLSGGNFIEKSVDSLGRITGNYEIIRDEGAYGGSPWGFDKLHWISDRISGFQEDKTKGVFNGQDPLSFTDVLEITAIEQNISIVNENSRVTPSNRALIQLSHFPITNVTRVFNVTTGERYIVTNQNPDGTGTRNETGRIQISGSSLPAVSDILQVDYTWIFSYDPSFDYDDRNVNSNPRTVQDSIDWGFSNAVRREQSTLISSGSVQLATVTHQISSVISVNAFTSQSTNIVLSSGRSSVVVNTEVSNVISIIRVSDGAELWNTNKLDGSFSAFTIFLPTDTSAVLNDSVTVIYNAEDVFNVDDGEGSFSENKITIVPTATATAGRIVEVNYIADVNTILPATLLSALPAIRSGNGFNTISASGIGTQPTTHIFSSPSVVAQNLRQAPSKLALTIAGAISPGVITVTGTNIVRAADIVYTVGTSGLKQDLKSALRTSLGLSSSALLPSNLKIARLISMEKVETSSDLDVLDVLHTYDIKGYALQDNKFVKDESIINSQLSSTEILLPTTDENVSNSPSVGSRIRITFYYILESSTENVLFSKSGTLYTNKTFATIDSIAISSGFTSGTSASATLLINAQNQPLNGARYRASYDYTAPKTNERISIRYNYNRLITDSTFNIESARPINADVLGKESKAILVDIEMNIVVTTEFKNNTITVQQNVQDAVTAALNATALGTIVDYSDLESVASSVDGVDRVRTMFFNKSNLAGSVLSISAEKNEFIRANEVIINIENR